MWFKKMSVLKAEGHYDTEKSADGTDWRTTNKYGTGQTWSASQTLPSAADAGNYFYLPALSSYSSGQLNYIGISGYYWSSSAYPWGFNNTAYSLIFTPFNVTVGSSHREDGFRVDGFE